MLSDNVKFRMLLAESARSAHEEDRSVGLWEEGKGNEGESGPNEANPKRPAPTNRGTCKASNDWGE